MGLGFAIIVLASWIVIARIGGDDSVSTVSINLDAPIAGPEVPPAQMPNLDVPPKPVDVMPQPPVAHPEPVVAPVEQPKPTDYGCPIETDGTPVRVVEDRKEVTFNPDRAPKKPAQKPVAAKKPIKNAAAPVKKPVASANGGIYVQFGSYSTRELAQAGEAKLRKSHAQLLEGKQFVILAAQVKGQTTYRLRVPFHSLNEANGFCRNAKSDGLDCYVTK